MSTSTFSNILTQLFYVISGFKGPYFHDVFKNFEDEPKKFMITQRKPISNFVHLLDKEKMIYGIDSDQGIFQPVNTVLINIGKIVERQLTMPRQEFIQRYVDEVPPDSLKPIQDYHRFMQLNNEICLRSQIDCYSIKDGKPFIYEIKSRSAAPFRYDFNHYEEYFGYQIDKLEGLYSSFEREFYDLIRGAFLKWSFQLKIGNMDGAFVAYHNVQKIQGFQFIQTSEINKRIFGTEKYAETLFAVYLLKTLFIKVASRLSTTMLEELIIQLKEEEYESFKLGVYASSHQRKLILFVELYKSKEEIENNQLIKQTKEINDEYDYYTKYKPLKNKVLKFEMNLKIFVNGIQQVAGCRVFREGDLLNIEYNLIKLGEADFKDYMNFLHDCYKHEDINLELTYAGAWLKVV